jgi:phage N-6-adenine-methyltransferase
MIKKRTMGSHQSANMMSDQWFTPRFILDELYSFDLDPCTSENRPWETAKYHYTKADNGLKKKWFGRIWLNPPYSREAIKWLEKMSQHQSGIALIFARTETKWFKKYIWERGHGILFLYGRIYFYRENGKRAEANSGAPSCLVAYSELDANILKNCDIPGIYFDIYRKNREG